MTLSTVESRCYRPHLANSYDPDIEYGALIFMTTRIVFKKS